MYPITPILTTYFTCRQHDVIPSNEDLLKPITHVALAFLRSDMFLDPDRNEWPLFRTVESARQAFSISPADILVAIGGWGDTSFAVAARNHTSRKMFAHNVARMVEATGADGEPASAPLSSLFLSLSLRLSLSFSADQVHSRHIHRPAQG